jgi:ketosteroid isomerase-like protein
VTTRRAGSDILGARCRRRMSRPFGAVEAWNADDLDAALTEVDPAVEWHPSIEPALEGGETTYRGYDGMRKAWDDYRGGAWERLTVRIQEIRDLGDSVLVLGHFDLTARTTHIRFHEEVGSLMTFRGGKTLRSEDYLSHAKALEAAGLSE